MDDAERSFVRRVLIVLALVALTLAAWGLRFILLAVFGAVLVAVILRAIAAPIQRFAHAPPRTALTAAVIGVLAVIAGAAWLFGAEAAAEARAFSDALPQAVSALEQRLEGTLLGDQVRQWLDGLAALDSGASQVLSGAGNLALLLGNGLAAALLVLVGGIYFAGEPRFYRTGVLKLVPKAKRPLLGEALDDCARALRLWLIGQLAAMAVVGVLTGLGLWLIGVPSALALAVLAAAAEFVPYLGPIVAAVPALLIALGEGGNAVLLTALLYFGVQQVESYALTPLLQQHVATLPAALTLFAIVAAGVLFGLPGIVLAAPLTVVTYVLVKRLYVREALETPTPVPGEAPAKSH